MREKGEWEGKRGRRRESEEERDRRKWSARRKGEQKKCMELRIHEPSP